MRRRRSPAALTCLLLAALPFALSATARAQPQPNQTAAVPPPAPATKPTIKPATDPAAPPKIKALVIDGQNNHDWKATTPVLKVALESCGRFAVDVVTTPQDKNWANFKPDFAKYGVVVSNYNGDAWPEPVRKAFEQYVANGGGFVSVHAADNAFPDWPEYNRIIGLGGWGGRDQKAGPYLRYRDGRVVPDAATPGPGGSHGQYHAFLVETRQTDHPIVQGLPEKWMHAPDELYDRLRGPAEHVTVLATAFADKASGGSGEHEPVLFTVDYGKGRVFHTVLGHDVNAMRCVGFITTLQRGAEWAATGKVTVPKPGDFPTEDKVSQRELPQSAAAAAAQ